VDALSVESDSSLGEGKEDKEGARLRARDVFRFDAAVTTCCIACLLGCLTALEHAGALPLLFHDLDTLKVLREMRC
jgi:hypothetical protein